MVTIANFKPKVSTKHDRSVDNEIIAIGMFDAYLHGTICTTNRCDITLKNHDIALIATKFAMFLLEQQRKNNVAQNKRYNLNNVIANYVAGYAFGVKQWRAMDNNEQQRIIDVFKRDEDGNEDNDDSGVSALFDEIRDDIEKRCETMDIMSVDDFVGKTMEVREPMQGGAKAMKTKKVNKG